MFLQHGKKEKIADLELHIHLYNSLDLVDEQRVDIVVEAGGLEPVYNINH